MTAALLVIGALAIVLALSIAAALYSTSPPPKAPRSRRHPHRRPRPAPARDDAAAVRRSDLERFQLIREAELASFDAVADLFLRRHPGAVLYDLRDELQRRAAIAAARRPDDDEGGPPDAA